jgi:hypothetical protein
VNGRQLAAILTAQRRASGSWELPLGTLGCDTAALYASGHAWRAWDAEQPLELLTPDGERVRLELLAELRAHVDSCTWADLEPGDALELEPAQLVRGIARHYDGGLDACAIACADLWELSS